MNALGVIARDIGVSDRTLRRAVDLGTLRAVRPSPRTIRISALESAFIRQYWPVIAQLRTALSNERNVALAVLYGSFARGEAGGESDIDLAVRLEDHDFDRLLDLQGRLEVKLQRDIDLLPIDDLDAEPGLAAAVADEGRVIVDRDGVWSKERDRLSGMYDPAASEQRIRAALTGIDRLLAERGIAP